MKRGTNDIVCPKCGGRWNRFDLIHIPMRAEFRRWAIGGGVLLMLVLAAAITCVLVLPMRLAPLVVAGVLVAGWVGVRRVAERSLRRLYEKRGLAQPHHRARYDAERFGWTWFAAFAALIAAYVALICLFGRIV